MSAVFDYDQLDRLGAIAPNPERDDIQTLIEQFSADCNGRNIVPSSEIQNFLLDLYNLYRKVELVVLLTKRERVWIVQR